MHLEGRYGRSALSRCWVSGLVPCSSSLLASSVYTQLDRPLGMALGMGRPGRATYPLRNAYDLLTLTSARGMRSTLLTHTAPSCFRIARGHLVERWQSGLLQRSFLGDRLRRLDHSGVGGSNPPLSA